MSAQLASPHVLSGNTAFVLSLFDTGLGAVRSLGRAGVRVVGLDFNPRMPGFKSRYCTAKVCPDPVQAPERLLRFLLDEGARLDQPGIIFPASDAFVLFLSRFRNELATCFRFILPPSDVVEAIVDKRRQYEMAERAGIPCPSTRYPETMDEVQRIKCEVEYPALIKPCYGHLWRKVFGVGLAVVYQGVRRLRSLPHSWDHRVGLMALLGCSVVVLGFSVLIGEKHYLSSVPLLLTLLAPNVESIRVRLLWLAGMILVGSTYALYWVFVKPV